MNPKIKIAILIAAAAAFVALVYWLGRSAGRRSVSVSGSPIPPERKTPAES